MIGKMNLRSCAVLQEKGNQLLEKNNFAESALNKKENQQIKVPNRRGHGNFANNNGNTLINCHSLKNLKKCSIKNIVNEEEKDENISTNVGVFHGKENRNEQRIKRRVVKQSSPKLKSCLSSKQIKFQEIIDSTVDEKTPKILSENKQRRNAKKLNVADKKDILTEHQEINKIPFNEILNCHPETRTKQPLIAKKKRTNKETDLNHIAVVPVWKNVKFNKPMRAKKQKSFVDVYDISQDEDMSNEVKVKKKKINRPKNIKRGVIERKYVNFSIKNGKSKLKYSSNTSNPAFKRAIEFDTDQNKSDTIHNKPATIVTSNSSMPPDQITKESDISVSIVENNGHDTPVQVNDMHAVSECISFDDPSVELELESQDNKKNKCVLDIVNEFEKSLLIPRMTSTPYYSKHNKTGVPVQQVNALKIIDLSHITSKNKQCLNAIVTTSSNLSPNDDPVKDVDITLFESPVKEQEKKATHKFNSPKKSIQINLFDENSNSPSKVDNLEDSVLRSKKAYTPDNFKAHLPRTKRAVVIKKSKEDLWIQKMSQHFAEISDTKLCIE